MNAPTDATPKVCLGQIVMTAHACEVLSQEDIMTGLQKHMTGDWGEVPPEDRESNDLAVGGAGRVLSAYPSSAGTFWIITEADRSVTTVLMPEDY